MKVTIGPPPAGSRKLVAVVGSTGMGFFLPYNGVGGYETMCIDSNGQILQPNSASRCLNSASRCLEALLVEPGSFGRKPVYEGDVVTLQF